MTKQEQTVIIQELCDTLAKSMLAKVDKLPDSWDGIELRWLLIDVAHRFIPGDTAKRQMKRRKEFCNTVLVENL